MSNVINIQFWTANNFDKLTDITKDHVKDAVKRLERSNSSAFEKELTRLNDIKEATKLNPKAYKLRKPKVG